MSDVVTMPKTYLKKIDMIVDYITSLRTEEWMLEKDVMKEFNLSKDSLRRIKNAHPECFRYRPSDKGCDSLGRTIRRGVMYNRVEIEKLYKKVL